MTTKTNDMTPVATIEVTSDGYYIVNVAYPFAGVSRPHTYGCSTGNKVLAERLVRAIEAGVAITGATVRTDVNGNTYVQGTNKFLSKRLNADLRRLGY